MKIRILLTGFTLCTLVSACRTSHTFVLRDEKPVSGSDAPYIQLTVKTFPLNIKGHSLADSSGKIKVEEVAPSQTLLRDFDTIAYTKIISAACDDRVKDLEITEVTENLAKLAWGFAEDSNSSTQRKPQFVANFTISSGPSYELSCYEAGKEQ